MSSNNTCYEKNKEKLKEIVITQRVVKQNRKNIMKITKKGFNDKKFLQKSFIRKKDMQREYGRNRFKNSGI